LWSKEGDDAGSVCKTTITEESPVTAVDFTNASMEGNSAYLAVGTEAGRLLVYELKLKDMSVAKKFVVPTRYVRH
jgi:elongator complex protein 2